MRPTLTPSRVWLARGIAVAADVLQIGLFPYFAEGALSPLDDVLDVLVAVALIALLGWHWVFLPSLVAELIPGLDMVPTWTAAVFFATRHGAARPAAPAATPGALRDVQVQYARSRPADE